MSVLVLAPKNKNKSELFDLFFCYVVSTQIILETAASEDVKTVGAGFYALVNCVYISAWVEATIWEWDWSKSKHFPEGAI